MASSPNNSTENNETTKTPTYIKKNALDSVEKTETIDQDEPETSIKGTQTGKLASDTFSLIGEEQDTEEEACKYKQYLCLLREIRAENTLIARYKCELEALYEKRQKTIEDLEESIHIQQTLRNENMHLQSLVSLAIHLQNTGSKRKYGLIPVETMPEED